MARLCLERKSVGYVPGRQIALSLLSNGSLTSADQGISLSVEQYNHLLKAIPEINAALRDLGHDVDDSAASVGNGATTTKKVKKEKPAKANIEATSEEDN